MRIGGSVLEHYNSPDEWIGFVKDLRYSAVLAPFDYKATSEEKKAYIECAKENNVVIAEVGAWKNPLSIDEAEKKSAIEYCINQLALADEINANCCVNIIGARGEKWDGFYRDNYSQDVYDFAVDSIRNIIDAVKPKHTFYTIEPMPWMVPDSPDSYLKLINDVDRPSFAVHMDCTNMINSPKRYLFSNEFISECFAKLGPYIKSVHIKDVIMRDKLPCCIEEVVPGAGGIDFAHVLRLCESLGKDSTAFIEHLTTYDEYKLGIRFIRRIAKEEGIEII